MSSTRALAIAAAVVVGILAALSVGPANASSSEERRAVRALERIATALERGACQCPR
jgi:hypothetical protein